MISENDKIASGVVKLQSAARPPLAAGDYTVKTGIVVSNVDENGKDVVFTNESLNFNVTGPRLSLDPSLIYGLYPLAGSSGAYHTSLPHIVFTSKTLPWEREIDNSGKNQNPWFALLLLTADELKSPVITKEITAEELIVGNNIILPNIILESWETKTDDEDKKPVNIKVMEMPLALYNSISPQANELSCLAHTRQVDMSDKEDTGINQKGWFSVVVGSRLPQPEQSHTVFLVSLEGLPPVPVPDSKSNIRLVILKQWSFQESGATFEELAENLTGKDLPGKGNIMPFRIELAGLIQDKPGIQVDEIAQKALNYGYMPLPHVLRNGQKTTSWYRGPLVPVDIAYPQFYQYNSADQTLRFDPNTGLFDISYSAAWQLGRLLALRSPGYFKALGNWKASWRKEKDLLAAAAVLKDKKIDLTKNDTWVHDVESDEILTDLLIELWTQST